LLLVSSSLDSKTNTFFYPVWQVLLYMSDLGESDGGETVFPHGWPGRQAEEDRVDFDTALANLRKSPDGEALERDSWEETLAARCQSRLAVQSRAGRAVLFYSQFPNGKIDKMSEHGGCPVLRGTKYAANLWLWSNTKNNNPGMPVNPNFKGELRDVEKKQVKQNAIALFLNPGDNPAFDTAELFFEDQFFAKLPVNKPVEVRTFEGNVWRVKVNGETIKTWKIGKKLQYSFQL
jgi:hypothetical protein